MALLWQDVQLALTIILFIFIYKWASDFLKSSILGIILAAVISYLTFYLHPELIIPIILVFFAFPFWQALAEGLAGEKGGK